MVWIRNLPDEFLDMSLPFSSFDIISAMRDQFPIIRSRIRNTPPSASSLGVSVKASFLSSAHDNQ